MHGSKRFEPFPTSGSSILRLISSSSWIMTSGSSGIKWQMELLSGFLFRLLEELLMMGKGLGVRILVLEDTTCSWSDTILCSILLAGNSETCQNKKPLLQEGKNLFSE